MKKIIQNSKEHKLLALKAAREAEKVLPIFEKHSKDKRPRKAIQAARDWARGKIKCGKARKSALNAHAAARKTKNLEARYAARACGHAAATCHVVGHVRGVKYYIGKIREELKSFRQHSRGSWLFRNSDRFFLVQLSALRHKPMRHLPYLIFPSWYE